jgi:hypothetical protein
MSIVLEILIPVVIALAILVVAFCIARRLAGLKWIKSSRTHQCKRIRITLEMDSDTNDYFVKLAKDEGVQLTEIYRRALSIIKAHHEQRKRGFAHLGFVSDPTKLDVELTGILHT